MAKKTTKAALDEAKFRRELFRAWYVPRANLHLDAYSVDGNPLHILRAVLLVAEQGETLNNVMVDNLRHAISALEKPPPRNKKPPPRNTLRDLRILRRIYIVHRGKFPKRVSDKLASDIAKREHTSVENVRMIVSRHRATLTGRSAR